MLHAKPIATLNRIVCPFFVFILTTAIRRFAHRCGRHRWALVSLLLLDASILEPDLHLLLGQLQRVRNLDATQTRQVLAGGEFALQFEQLAAGEGRPDAFARVGHVGGGRGGRRRRRTVCGGGQSVRMGGGWR